TTYISTLSLHDALPISAISAFFEFCYIHTIRLSPKTIVRLFRFSRTSFLGKNLFCTKNLPMIRTKIAGAGHYVPENVVTNKDLEDRKSTRLNSSHVKIS